MHLALLVGGISAERPISLKSAEGLKTFLAETNHTYDIYDVPSEIDAFLANYKKYDIVIPYIHGRYGEDGVLTGMCESLRISYACSSSATHALCLDKFRTNCVIASLGIHVPKTWFPGVNEAMLAGVRHEERSLEFPLIIKPNNGGSSTATSKISQYGELEEAFSKVRALGENDEPLVQECIEGEEYTVGLVGSTENPEALPIMQIVNIKSALFDWQEKYESDGSNEIFPENMDPRLQNELVETSKKIFTALGCRGVARIDYRVRDGVPYFLEVNTFPGATTASFIPKMWQQSGRNMGEFIEMLLNNSTK